MFHMKKYLKTYRMKLTNNELNETFYDEQGDEYSASLEQVKEVISGPWEFTKQEFESGLLPSIRHKYLGTFQVYPGRAKNMLHHLKTRYDTEKISSKKYEKLTTMIKNYINELD